RLAHAPNAAPLAALPTLPQGARRPQRRTLALAGAIAAAVLLVATASGLFLTRGASAIQARANLTIFQGAVQIRHGSGSFAAARTNELIEQGDAVRTADSAHAVLTFFDQSVVVLEPNTEIDLSTLHTVSAGRDIDVVMQQTSGSSWHVVAHPIGSGGHYEVSTPTATSTVHGTAFQVRLDTQVNTVV